MIWLWLSFSGLLLHSADPPAGALVLRVENIADREGSIRIAVYDRAEVFLNEAESIRGLVAPVTPEATQEIVLSGLPFGRYAVAIHHDCNDNGKMDTNLFGIPKEPYAFSNNPEVKWRPPRFEEAVFEFKEDGQGERVVLEYWREK